jgi:arylsulfatase
MHALPKDIAKYEGRYDIGWDSLRQERYQRMIDMGLIDENWKMSAPNPEDEDWNSTEMKAWHIRCMEVYAAMLDNMDQGIGRIIAALEEKEELDNTLIFYLQDNGACAEEFRMHLEMPADIENQPLQPMDSEALQYSTIPEFTRDGRPVKVGRGVMPGPADTYIGYDQRWANASNTPFRMFKHWAHEGGIATPLIVHWPNGIDAKGEFRPQPGQLPDIMATCVDLADAQYPREYNSHTIQPMEGKSLVSSFGNQPLEREALYWEHEGNRAIRQGKWKLVSTPDNNPRYWDKTNELALENWELYNLEADRTETNNLAIQYPDRVQEMAGLWQTWAERVGAVPKPE